MIDFICMCIGYIVLLMLIFALLVAVAALIAPYWRKVFAGDFYQYYFRRKYIDNDICLAYYKMFGSYGNRYAARFRLRNLMRYKRIKQSNKY